MAIRVDQAPNCSMCGVPGRILYDDMEDRLFDVPGRWSFRQCTSPDCDMVWLDPRPREVDLQKLYATYYTHTPARMRRSITSFRSRLLGAVERSYLHRRFGYFDRHIYTSLFATIFRLHPFQKADSDGRVMHLPAQEGGRLLDIGCGDGQFLELMTLGGWDTEGVDLDPVAIKRARDKGLNVRLGLFDPMDYAPEQFDAITLSHVLEHSLDPVRLLTDCRRVLAPNGRIVAITPNTHSWGRRPFGRAWRGLEPPRHLFLFNPPLMQELTRRAGLDLQELSTTLRGSHELFVGSLAIRRSGKFRTEDRPSRVIRLYATAFQLIEWVLLKMSPEVGEEILLVATKTPQGNLSKSPEHNRHFFPEAFS